MRTLAPLIAGASMLAAVACGSGPRPIAAGDPCARCHMPVADEHWGAELVTRTGVVRTYDAIECLARDLEDEVVEAGDVASLWVVPFDAPGTLVRAEDAVYVRSAERRSPMGLDLTAFAPGSDLDAFGVRDGVVLDWEGVRALVAASDPAPGHAHGAGVD